MPEGLRERKRRQTHERLEHAAVTLAVEEGVSAVTVDRVCERVMVSRSTFFNYFASLEHAIFGSPFTFDPARAEHVLSAHPDDLVLAALELIVESVQGGEPSLVGPQRVALFLREAGVGRPVIHAHAESRKRLARVLARWLDAHPDQARLPGVPSEREADMSVRLALAVGNALLRDASEYRGDFPLDLGDYATERARLATILGATGVT